AAPAAKLAKGATLAADEVVLDLEDAVLPALKDEARAAVVEALAGEWAAESVAVRVNAIGSPWCHADLVALAASPREAVTAIHPAQLDALRETFTPTDEEVAGAREVLAALERAAAEGAGAVAADGQMLDEALALSARRVLARAGR